MHQYLLAAIEWAFMAAGLWLMWPYLGFKGLLGLFFAFVGFELHLIWHRRDRETKAARKNQQ